MTKEQLDDLSIRTALAAGAKWEHDKTTLELPGGKIVALRDWNGEVSLSRIGFATSRDAFFRDIVPVLKERGKWEEFCKLLNDLMSPFPVHLDPKYRDPEVISITLEREPHELCKAAIAVLQPDWRDAPMPPVETDYPVRDEDLESCEEDDGTRWTD